MSKKEYDVLVIGGGINGAAIAHDASLRGLKVALVEQKDFGSGTTSASSKLAHGGLRYLKNFELWLVRESLKERRILEKIAPHLVYPLPFIMPLYKDGPNKKSMIRMGMMIYDILSYDKAWMDYEEQKIQGHKMLTAEEVVKQEPRVLKDRLMGGVKYYDCQISSPERLCLEFILTAASNGADVSNYAKVEKVLIKDNKVRGVAVKDKTNGKEYKIKSKIVVNASGPWLDKIIETYDKNHKPILRGTKGIHIITPKLSDNAIILTTKKTERDFFIEPWRGHSLIGTTDTDYDGDLDTVCADKKDIMGLIGDVNDSYGHTLYLRDVKYSYAGVRPLKNEEGKKETEVSRKYEVREEDIEGLVTVKGGKLTTARNLAERTVDIIAKRLDKKVSCKTHETPLYGSTIGHAEYLEKNSQKNIENLINTYGSKYREVLKYSQSEIKAQILYAMEEEMALTLEDVMLRRTGIGTLGEPNYIYALDIAGTMADHLGWDNAKKIDEVINFKNKIKIRKW